MGGACGANGEEEHISAVGSKARGKKTTRKTKMLKDR
jgi:hypothetical protein